MIKKKAEIELEEVQKKINRFRWQNYLKDYSGDIEQLKSLYWNLVFNDIYGRKDLNGLSLHLGKSYLGIFFWAHKCQAKLQNLFKGLGFYDLEKEKKKWVELKNDVIDQRRDALLEILKLTQNNPPDSPYIIKHYPDTFHVNFAQFDHYYDDKTLPISSYLIKHLKPGRFWYRTSASPVISLQYQIDPLLIQQLHSAGEEVAKTLLLYSQFSEVDNQKEAFHQSKKDGKNMEMKWQNMTEYEKEMNPQFSYHARKQIRLPAEFTISNRTTPSGAIKILLEENQDYKCLSLSVVKNMILARFSDINGKPLNPDSVYKALSRSGFTN